MKKIINKIKENKKVAIPIILILVLIIGILSYIIVDKLLHPEFKDGLYYNEELGEYVGEETGETINVVDVIRDESEYLGEYENYEEEKDIGFLTILYRDFASTESNKKLINNFIDYKFPMGEYVVNAKNDKISIGMNNKKVVLFFANVFEDNKGNLTTSAYGEGMKLNKEAFEEYFDVELYILPKDTELSKKDFISVFPNGNFYNGSVSKTFAEVITKLEDYTSVMLCFNEDGSLLLATSAYPLEANVEYLELALKSNISIQEAFPKIVENYDRDQKELEEARKDMKE